MPSNTVAEILMQQGRDAAAARLASGQAWAGAVQQLGQIPGQVMQMRDQQQMRQLQQQGMDLQNRRLQAELDATTQAREDQKKAQAWVASIARKPDGTFDLGDALQSGAVTNVAPKDLENLTKTFKGINDVITSVNDQKLIHAGRLANHLLQAHSPEDPVTPDTVHNGIAIAKTIGLANDEEVDRITRALAMPGANPENVLKAIKSQSPEFKEEKLHDVAPEHTLVTGTGEVKYRAPAATPKPIEKPELQGQVVGSDGKVVPGTLTFEEHGRGYLLNGQPLPAGARVERAPAPSTSTDADIDTAARNLIANPQDNVSLKMVSSLRGDQRLRLFNKIKELDPSFNVGMIDRRIKFLDEYEDPKGRAAINRSAMNNILQHAADLSKVNQEFRRTDVRVANTVVNKIREQFGSTAYTAYQVPLTVLKEEIGLYFAGGYAPNVEQTKRWESISADNATPNQIEEFAKDISHVALRRANTHNEQFKTMMGYDDPNLITPAAKTAAQMLGGGLPEEVSKYGSGGQIGQAPPKTPLGAAGGGSGGRPSTETPSVPDLKGLAAGQERTFHSGPFKDQTWVTGADGRPRRVR